MSSAPSTKRPTLAAVAAAAGVSVATVSKVLNGRQDVAPQTRSLVEGVLREQEYVARGTAAPTTGTTLDLVFDALHAPYTLEVIRGVVEACSERDLEVVVGTVPDDPGGATWARRLARAQRLGLVLVTSRVSPQQFRAFAEAEVPLVTIDPVNLPDPQLVSVGATNFNGGMDATAHLISLGHTRIGFVEGPPDAMVSLARLHGLHAALSQAGLAAGPELIRSAEFTFEGGYTAARALLEQTPRPTAVFASNDAQAFGAIEAARTLGLRVPDDLSVVGFDDVAAAQWSAPPLTTVRQPLRQMGRAAVERTVRLAAGERLNSARVEFATELVVRKSTGPPR